MSQDASSIVPRSTCSLCGYGLNLSRLKSGGFTMPSRPNHPTFPFSYTKIKKSAEDGCEDCHILQQAIDFTTPQNSAELCQINLNTLKEGRPALLLLGGQRVELFSLSGLQEGDDPEYAIGNGKVIEGSLDFDTALKQIRYWLGRCEERHDGCLVSDNPMLPTRVLSLEQKDGALSIALKETGGSRGRYMTLSHCWGASRPLITTQDTIEQRKTNIPTASLPTTFLQAAMLASGLGIQYLWIDSLCIIQEDPQDWNIEAGKMAEIYTNSFLNVAGAATRDSTGPLFSTGENNTTERILQSYKIQGSKADRLEIYARIVEEKRMTGSKIPDIYSPLWTADTKAGVVETPLLHRAWVFQERLLSPRNVYFHASEMVWDCKSQIRCECGHIYHGNKFPQSSFYLRPSPASFDPGSLNSEWENIVYRYTHLSLTLGKDKLPALAGIAKVWAPYMKSCYLAGIWASGLPQNLFWMFHYYDFHGGSTNYARRAKPYRAPSWSWASVDTVARPVGAEKEISFATGVIWRFLSNHMDPYVRVIKVTCTSSNENPFGEVTSGVLVIEGLVLQPARCRWTRDDIEGDNANDPRYTRTRTDTCHVEFDLNQRVMDSTSNAHGPALDPEIQLKLSPTSYKFDLDAVLEEGDEVPANTLRCLIIGTSVGLSPTQNQEGVANCTYGCLLLKAGGIEGDKILYEKVGTGSVHDPGLRIRKHADLSTMHII